jgi:hypothetical protein
MPPLIAGTDTFLPFAMLVAIGVAAGLVGQIAM